jgi:hypothetical protein
MKPIVLPLLPDLSKDLDASLLRTVSQESSCSHEEADDHAAQELMVLSPKGSASSTADDAATSADDERDEVSSSCDDTAPSSCAGFDAELFGHHSVTVKRTFIHIEEPSKLAEGRPRAQTVPYHCLGNSEQDTVAEASGSTPQSDFDAALETNTWTRCASHPLASTTDVLVERDDAAIQQAEVNFPGHNVTVKGTFIHLVPQEENDEDCFESPCNNGRGGGGRKRSKSLPGAAFECRRQMEEEMEATSTSSSTAAAFRAITTPHTPQASSSASGGDSPSSPRNAGDGHLRLPDAAFAAGAKFGIPALPIAAPPCTTPCSLPLIPLGTEVEIEGLSRVPRFNGRVGVVTSWDAEMQRYDVALHVGLQAKVKGENLRYRTPPPPCFAPILATTAAGPTVATNDRAEDCKEHRSSASESRPGSLPSTPRWEEDEQVLGSFGPAAAQPRQEAVTYYAEPTTPRWEEQPEVMGAMMWREWQCNGSQPR